MYKTKVVKFNGNPLLGVDECYNMLQEYMNEGDTLKEALEQVLLFEVKEQYLHYNTNGWKEWECKWDLDNEVTLTLMETKL